MPEGPEIPESNSIRGDSSTSKSRVTPKRFIRAIVRILRGRPELNTDQADDPVLKTLFDRRSIRRFEKDRPIPDEEFRVILEAGRTAPSGVNLQTWSFGVYDRETWKTGIGTPMPFGADRAVLICGDAHRARDLLADIPPRPLVEYTLSVMNASIAAFAMNMAAEARGIGSVMLSDTGRGGFYDAAYLRDRLHLPPGVFPVMTIVFGYPRERPPAMPPRLPMEAVTFTDRYRETDPDVLRDWWDQMRAGYRATRPWESLDAQLRRYRSRIDEAEEGLREMIYPEGGSPRGKAGEE